VLGCILVRFCCWNLFISDIDDCIGRKVFGFLTVDFVYRFCIGFIVFIVLWNIAHAVFLQLLACKESPCIVVEDQ